MAWHADVTDPDIITRSERIGGTDDHPTFRIYFGSAKPSPYPLVLIDWEDSARPYADWQFVEDIKEAKAVQCRTVGWLIQSGEVMAVAANMGQRGDDDVQVCGVIEIPKRAIIKMRTLET